MARMELPECLRGWEADPVAVVRPWLLNRTEATRVLSGSSVEVDTHEALRAEKDACLARGQRFFALLVDTPRYFRRVSRLLGIFIAHPLRTSVAMAGICGPPTCSCIDAVGELWPRVALRARGGAQLPQGALAALEAGEGRCKELGSSAYDTSDQGFFDRRPEAYPDDEPFATALASFLDAEKPLLVVDVGSGNGAVARAVAARAAVSVLGLDGNANTALAERGAIFEGGGSVSFRRLDLTRPFPASLPESDWAVCLAVAEHITFQLEHLFLANLQRVAGKGLIMAWDARGSPGTGHVNTRDRDEVLRIFQAMGFALDATETDKLQRAALRRWYKLALVLRRTHEPSLSLQDLAVLARAEHETACWPPAYNQHRELCCSKGGWVAEGGATRGTSCFGEGFSKEACCASIDDYELLA